MDYGREFGFSGGNVVQVGTTGSENWIPNTSDQQIWATEDDYGMWSGETNSIDTQSNSNYDERQTPNQHPNKKSRNSQMADSHPQGSGNRSKAIGKMFFKTKLCCKFRSGTCPYVTNCNFAHSIEELRRPPPNWQEIMASHNEEPREEFQIPALSSTNFGGESQRSYKGRHCKKFYTEEGCPYGDNCTFLHDEQSKTRESVAISLGPGVGGGYGGGSGGGSGGGGGNGSSGSNLKPSNWKTRICNKWELTGYCPFGDKCHFAHGMQELHRYGGGLVEMDARDSPSAPLDSKQVVGIGVPSKTPADTVTASSASVPHGDVYHIGVPSQRSSTVMLRPGERPLKKWKGPDKISRIYGDWIDDIE